jgi:hypothetical protein
MKKESQTRVNKSNTRVQYKQLEPEIRHKLDRYLSKLSKSKGQTWRLDKLYKPSNWHRAQLRGPNGASIYIWYRAKRGHWAISDKESGRGIFRRSRRAAA